MNEPVRTDDHPFQDPSLDGPTAEDQIRLDVEDAADGQVIIRVGGDLDLLTAGLLRDHLASRLKAPARVVVLDLTSVDFLGSAGLSELVAANETANRNGVRLALVAASRAVLRPLEITGLRALFEIHDSVEAATEPAEQV